MASLHFLCFYLGFLLSLHTTMVAPEDVSQVSDEVDKLDVTADQQTKLERLDKDLLDPAGVNEPNKKRNLGRWKNYNWNAQQYKQDREKRFIGRWKNMNWLNSRQSLPGFAGPYNDVAKRPDGYFDNTPYEDELIPYLYGDDMYEKRQGGRWALIQRQLNRLGNRRSKKDDELNEFSNDGDNIDKRMDSRWLLIQNKLRNLGGRSKRNDDLDKRYIGRWKNYNWILSNGNQNSALSIDDKRNIGRWKNQNWILQKYRQNRDRKSNSFSQ